MSDELQYLDPATCLTLVQQVAVGRIAWAQDDGTVTVLPVNFVMDGEALVFTTAPGAKLDAVHVGRPLTFEAGDLEPALGDRHVSSIISSTGRRTVPSSSHEGRPGAAASAGERRCRSGR
ncbi:pyridoxamine 5'-phosphate oxidase family protein [Spirillospora sp. NPDC048819]|uniref:pyridoxamine 5'-phosphate oxidase family protein n=1 Tax=Spirillospora sp. NPDC048819 TaxID=3155268 RepID=UPI003400752B